MINVLDHGFVDLRDHMGDDLSICRAARVSYGGENYVQERTEGENRKLIRYLMCHKHTSPFEQVVFTFHVKAPIFVFRQWHRHRTWSFNEISGRYSELPEQYYIPEVDQIKKQSKSNKQGRDEEFNQLDALDLQETIRENSERCFIYYHEALEEDLAREVARIQLPLATYSEMYATVDLHNLFHFLKLRMDSHSQYEIQVYAKAIYELIKPIVPEACMAWEMYVNKAVTFSSQEMVMLKDFIAYSNTDVMRRTIDLSGGDLSLSKREQEEFKKKLGLE